MKNQNYLNDHYLHIILFCSVTKINLKKNKFFVMTITINLLSAQPYFHELFFRKLSNRYDVDAGRRS